MMHCTFPRERAARLLMQRPKVCRLRLMLVISAMCASRISCFMFHFSLCVHTRTRGRP